ncbi:MAG: hypothetical protein JW969_06960 [Spirochaetales bacterium]|nr:hypothetical protein [Spirochaetales bacterium]
MNRKKPLTNKSLFLIPVLILFLISCGPSASSKIIGEWQWDVEAFLKSEPSQNSIKELKIENLDLLALMEDPSPLKDMPELDTVSDAGVKLRDTVESILHNLRELTLMHTTITEDTVTIITVVNGEKTISKGTYKMLNENANTVTLFFVDGDLKDQQAVIEFKDDDHIGLVAASDRMPIPYPYKRVKQE